MKKFLVVLVIILAGLQGYYTYLESKDRPVYGKDVDRLSRNYIRSLNYKYDMTCSGTGGGFIDNVNNLFYQFDLPAGEFNIDQARELILECVDELLERVNKDEKLQPYLSHYPYTDSGVSLRLVFYREGHVRPDKGSLEMVNFCDNKLRYSTFDPEAERYVTLHRESVAEARQKVHEVKE